MKSKIDRNNVTHFNENRVNNASTRTCMEISDFCVF